MRQTLSYNIHDIVKFQIIRDRKFDFSDLIKLRFSCFEVEQVDKPDIILKIGKFTPSKENCYLLDHKYYIKDNYFYCHESEGKVAWKVEIIGFERGTTTINFHADNRFQMHPINLIRVPLFLPQAFLLRTIEHKLSTKGYFLIHSAAVSKDNQAYLLTGREGCFKTSLCMDFVRHAGFTCMGDDRAILYQNRVLNFPMNSAIFEFMTHRLPDERHLGFLSEVQFATRYFLGGHRKTGREGARSAELKALLVVTKSEGLSGSKRVNFESVPQSSLEQTVDSLLLNNKLEDLTGFMPGFGINSAPLFRYLLAYTFVFPNNSVVTQERKLAEHLRGILAKIPIYKVKIPPDYDLAIFNQIYEFIFRNCHD